MRITLLKQQIAVIEHGITHEMVETLKAVKPAALSLKDEDKNTIFVVDFVKKGEDPQLSEYGVTVSKDRDIIMTFDKPVTEAIIRKALGAKALRLQALETQVVAAFNALSAEIGAITVEVA